uniref:DUF1990 domain-containing protein n=1 Tax=Tetraselmis chuii TaxID=63592 RepID=A0A7S1X6Y4_9CHLO|mmetsp:Transcript_38496/g.69005  ORF Transcript_38496/g.69005 Transcript_38496/m.69005 type:complete len:232 (+) Transcript_38496:123-818(+)
MVFLSLTRPSALQVDEAVSHGSRQGFNYRHVGKTEGAPPLDDELVRERWTVDHTRVQVGKGRAAYEEGKRALKSWQHFQLGWTTVDASTRVEKGSKARVSPSVSAEPSRVCSAAQVCVVARAVLPWTRNPLEIVYAKEGSRKVPASDGKGGTNAKVFSFAHGCLGGHLLAGEERFAMEWRKDDDSVWYEIYTFSKPAHALSLATYPVVRLLQKKFASDSTAAMQRTLSRPS